MRKPKTRKASIPFLVRFEGAPVASRAKAAFGATDPLYRTRNGREASERLRVTDELALMVATELLERNPRPSKAEIEEAISSNLCRCTGYYTIVESVQRAAELMQEGAK